MDPPVLAISQPNARAFLRRISNRLPWDLGDLDKEYVNCNKELRWEQDIHWFTVTYTPLIFQAVPIVS